MKNNLRELNDIWYAMLDNYKKDETTISYKDAMELSHQFKEMGREMRAREIAKWCARVHHERYLKNA